MEIDKGIIVAIITAFGSLILWYVKTIFCEIKGLKQFDINNKDKIKDNFFTLNLTREQLAENKALIERHDKRLDSHDRRIDTVSGKVKNAEKQLAEISKKALKNEGDISKVIVTHNSSHCGKANKIEA